MKTRLKKLVCQAVQKAFDAGKLSSNEIPPFDVEEPKAEAHGDFSTNIAMVSARFQKRAPRDIAAIVCDHLDMPSGFLHKVEIAGPGFINFFLHPQAWHPVLTRVHQEDRQYGASTMGEGRRVQVEFVSANPTGPLHVGHGRGAAVGDTVANLLRFCGYAVEKEYYINDSGRQIRTLGLSVFLRYRELLGQSVDFPAECYQGEYIRDLAIKVHKQQQAALLERPDEDAVAFCARLAADTILAGIRDDLAEFGITYDCWFSEQSLYDEGRVEAVLERFAQTGVVYQKDGAQWFGTSRFGDEKDRVVVRQNGQTTYFASDIAYHQEKFERGFERVIDVWGADHHGYIQRVKASIEAGGLQPDAFQVILVQLVNLLRGGQPVAMSTRSGEFVTLGDVVREVGRDAARFIFLTRHYESDLDFDLELAKQKTNDNPVYYVQYVHARIASIFRKAAEQDISAEAAAQAALDNLKQDEEFRLIKLLARFPEIIKRSADLLEPHRLTYYLMELAAGFHSYYNKHRVLVDDPELSKARLYLIWAVQKVIRNGLELLGVSAPERM